MNQSINGCRILLFLYITFFSIGTISGLLCYKCQPQKQEECASPVKKDGFYNESLQVINCADIPWPEGGKNETQSETDADSTDPTNPSERLIQRQESGDTLGCIIMIGIKGGKEQTHRGCGTSNCAVAKQMLFYTKVTTCKHCKEDLCNRSHRVSRISWASFLLIAVICVGVNYYLFIEEQGK